MMTWATSHGANPRSQCLNIRSEAQTFPNLAEIALRLTRGFCRLRRANQNSHSGVSSAGENRMTYVLMLRVRLA